MMRIIGDTTCLYVFNDIFNMMRNNHKTYEQKLFNYDDEDFYMLSYIY